MRDEYEVSLAGMEAQLRAKKDQQADFLKKKLALRRKGREKELVEGGRT